MKNINVRHSTINSKIGGYMLSKINATYNSINLNRWSNSWMNLFWLDLP